MNGCESVSYGAVASSVARLWPNSWKKVTTSAWLSSAGVPGAGLGQFPTMTPIGGRNVPSAKRLAGSTEKFAKCEYLPGRG